MTRHRLRILFIVCCCPGFLAFNARADRLGSNIKTADAPGIFQKQIDAVIDSEISNLKSDDAIAQKLGRTTLIYESQNHAGATASSAYQGLYATECAKALLKVFNSSASNVRVRLNVAVATTEVCVKVNAGGGSISAFAPLVQAMLNDRQTAVVLWGMKAAKYIIADGIVMGPGAGTFPKLIVKAVKAHGDSGFVVEEAYNALTLDQLRKLSEVPNFKEIVAPILPDLLDVIAWRTAQYQKPPDTGVPSPQAERVVTGFLSVTAYAAVHANPVIEKRSLTVLGDMTCTLVNSASGGNASPEMIEMIRDYGQAFDNFGDQFSNLALQQAGRSIKGISASTNPATMNKHCQALDAQLKLIGVNINSDGTSTLAGSPK